MKLGSLFDGIAGFPLAASKFNIESAWASEIEPWPIKVSGKWFPKIKHLGDITQINGTEIEPVDIICGGSPCQDLSVAGKRAGLEGERSGLFMEMIRIVREMREATNGEYPRFLVWENVPGAFSSNKGEDFRAVLEEITDTQIPMPASGRWAAAGMVRTNRTETAWRVLDAQYWGVPQRRKRIFLVADFGGHRAGEILFVEPCLRGHFAESREKRKGTSPNVETGVRKSIGFSGKNSASLNLCPSEELSPTLRAGAETHVLTIGIDQQSGKGQANYEIDKCPTICSDSHGTPHAVTYALGCSNDQYLFEPRSADGVPRIYDDGICPTLNTMQGGQRQPCVLDKAVSVHQNQCGEVRVGTVANTLNTNSNPSGRNAPLIAFNYAVRRLTPLECLRLQGFPDYWLDIEGMSDTQKYKAVGNSVAVPCVEYVMEGLARVLQEK